MKRIFISVVFWVMIAVSLNANIVDNSATRDTLSIPFMVLDSAGNAVDLASGDSVYIVVFYPGGTVAFKDSMAYDDGSIKSYDWEDFDGGKSYAYMEQVSVLDGSSPVMGVYSYILTVDDNTSASLTSTYMGTFQVVTSTLEGSLDSAGLALLSANKALDSLADIIDSVNAMLDSMQVKFANREAFDPTSDEVDADVVKISGDGPAADSLEFSLDGNVSTYREIINATFDEVENLDGWNPITDNDSLIVDQSTIWGDTSATPGIRERLLILAGDTSAWADLVDVWMNQDTSGIDTSGLGVWLINNLLGAGGSVDTTAIKAMMLGNAFTPTDTTADGHDIAVVDSSQRWAVQGFSIRNNSGTAPALYVENAADGGKAAWLKVGNTTGEGVGYALLCQAGTQGYGVRGIGGHQDFWGDWNGNIVDSLGQVLDSLRALLDSVQVKFANRTAFDPATETVTPTDTTESAEQIGNVRYSHSDSTLLLKGVRIVGGDTGIFIRAGSGPGIVGLAASGQPGVVWSGGAGASWDWYANKTNIPDAVWNEDTTGHYTPGTYGYEAAQAGSGSGADSAAVYGALAQLLGDSSMTQTTDTIHANIAKVFGSKAAADSLIDWLLGYAPGYLSNREMLNIIAEYIDGDSTGGIDAMIAALNIHGTGAYTLTYYAVDTTGTDSVVSGAVVYATGLSGNAYSKLTTETGGYVSIKGNQNDSLIVTIIGEPYHVFAGTDTVGFPDSNFVDTGKGYDISLTIPSSADLCNCYTMARNASGDGVEGAILVATMQNGRGTIDTCNNVAIMATELRSEPSDSTGLVQLELTKSKCLNRYNKYTFKIVYPSNYTDWIKNDTVPDAATWLITQ